MEGAGKSIFSKRIPIKVQKWLKISNFGKIINYPSNDDSSAAEQREETKKEATQKQLKLIPFKCPMCDTHDRTISKNKRLYPEDLYGHYFRQDIILKHVIDLTYTTKYYDPKSFQALGVNHIKMPLPGKVVPSTKFMLSFINQVEEIESKLASNEYIGIHCTHGLNRTGFMVVYYMCYAKKVNLKTALEAFNESRSPNKMDEEDLLKELEIKFGGSKPDE